MNTLSAVKSGKLRYDHIIGTGGIGWGMVFSLKGDHTLGRNESRLATLEPYDDYCKLHIIMHYVSVLLGAGPTGNFRSFPIGGVGSDEAGDKLLAQMKQAGMIIGSVRKKSTYPTLYSVCYQYPDFSGGNITTEKSASSKVRPDDIDDFFVNFETDECDGIVLAVPEVPLDTRIRLLRKGRERGYLNVASVLSSEVAEFKTSGGLGLTDLLALNIDEARSIANIEDESSDSDIVINRSVEIIYRSNPRIMLLITEGANGSYSFQDGKLEYNSILPAVVKSTAGAGDAFLAGTIAGICCGLPLQKGASNNSITETGLLSAVDLGTLLASLSVTSTDTIHMGVDASFLLKYAQSKGLALSDEFKMVFSQCLQKPPPGH
jgi:sugar/nucleoside kinase (ribokinase family)